MNLPAAPTRRTLILPLLALALLSGGCKDVADAIKPKLPDETQEGKGTFGCLVDDKLWLPYAEHTLDSEVEASYAGGVFSLRAEQENASKPVQYFYLRAAGPPGGGALTPGTYAVGPGFVGWIEVQETGRPQAYRSRRGQGTLTITKVEPRTNTSTVLGQQITTRFTIVSGTFHFTATDSISGKTVTVKDGRFDVQAF
ncbi:hypothetical protein EJV47_05490 [Hymenobacter gummosus]|uniref:Lipoprotein n=1 Tax=Hymenobacter gummosus TaxID=1776032 RepID=A0A3S0HQR7_9BACT|nr:hypothetical protein [Hymenobacter gummosus]RTQ52465.1 hypothetical protein EJV47_05490 [Hymenobacter gummosus]